MPDEKKKKKFAEGSPLPDQEETGNYEEIEKGILDEESQADETVSAGPEEVMPEENPGLTLSAKDVPALAGKSEGDTVTLIVTAIDGDNISLSVQEDEMPEAGSEPIGV